MTPALFQRFRDLVQTESGIDLTDRKDQLVSARISSRIKALHLESEAAYLELLLGPEGKGEISSFIDVISTNFTHFFREPSHFDLLRSFVKEVAASGKREIKVWCAAASTGEEPYSLAMVLDDVLGSRGVAWRLLASDISTRALKHAVAATYEEATVKPVPPALAHRYLRPAGSGRFCVVETLRSHVFFGRLNLSRPPFPMSGPFDAIFCRNVMIYFDTAVRQRLVGDVERLLAPGGIFVVGHTEPLTGVQTRLMSIAPSVYRKSVGRST
jgi:chemotaxis protein methyltransferase CheR